MDAITRRTSPTFETVLLAANYVAGAKAVPAMLISPLN
jgi:hypothetical protein